MRRLDPTARDVSRGRLTPVDIVKFGAAAFVTSLLAIPMYAIMQQNASELGAGSGLLFQIVFPLMVLSISYVVYLTAASGGSY